jgi:hypothetical protein
MTARYMQNLVGLVIHREGEGLLRGKTRCGLTPSPTWIPIVGDRDDALHDVLAHGGVRCTDCWPAKEERL